MEIVLKQGDFLPIPEGCKAVINDGMVVFERDTNFKDGDVLSITVLNNRKCPFIFKRTNKDGFNLFYVGLNIEGELTISGKYSHFGRGIPVLATEEEKQKLFDKMKEQGLRWNAEEKKVEKVRWRAKKGEEYYYVDDRGDTEVSREDDYYIDNRRHKVYNYFRTQGQAKKAAEAVREALRKFHEENG